jgi:hypothetical protein
MGSSSLYYSINELSDTLPSLTPGYFSLKAFREAPPPEKASLKKALRRLLKKGAWHICLRPWWIIQNKCALRKDYVLGCILLYSRQLRMKCNSNNNDGRCKISNLNGESNTMGDKYGTE